MGPGSRPIFGALASAALTFATAGCGDAAGQILGGQSLLLNQPQAPSEAGVSLLSPACQDGGAAWTDLYDCYFGPAAASTCAGNGAGYCHASLSEQGGSVSNFQCPPDPAACYAGITAAMSIVPAGGASDPTTTKLYQVLRMADGTCADPAGACRPPRPRSCFSRATSRASRRGSRRARRTSDPRRHFAAPAAAGACELT